MKHISFTGNVYFLRAQLSCLNPSGHCPTDTLRHLRHPQGIGKCHMEHTGQLQDVRRSCNWPLWLKTTQKVSLNTLAVKGGLRRVSILCWVQNAAYSEDDKKSEIFSAFFASIFNTKTSCTQDTQFPELEVRDGVYSHNPGGNDSLTCYAN